MASMTIKEAFQKLSKVTNAGIKNPWFVIRNLGQTFADVADNIEEGGGGSTVEVEPILESGTKIATISVDDDDFDLYAPMHNYSTTEQDTGLTWIDGKKIYQTTFVKDSTNISGTLVTIDASALNIDECINIYGTFDRIVSAGKLTCMFNSYEGAGLHSHLAYSNYNNMINFSITLFTGEATSTQNITILYTKSAS